MKKILSVGLLFLIIISLLVGCVNAPGDVSSINSDSNIDINDWYNADFLTDTEKEELFQKFRTNEISYHSEDLNHPEYWDIFRGEYSYPVNTLIADMGKENEWNKEEEKILLDNVGVKYLNKNMMGEKEAEAYTQFRLTRMPWFYEKIHRLNISREELIKANNKRKAELEKSIAEGSDVSLEENIFTDEEIGLLYSDNKDAIREHFKGSYIIFHNGKTYDIQYFWETEPERWAKENIPIETLNEWLEKLEEADIENYIRPRHFSDKEIQKRVLETYYMKQKIERYEALLEAE